MSCRCARAATIGGRRSSRSRPPGRAWSSTADSTDPNEWLRYAAEDLAAGEILIRQHPRHAARAFQESAEKALKAVVIAAGATPPRIHDVNALLELVSPGLRDGDPVFEAALEINAIVPARRYPGDLPEPTAEEAHSLRDAAARILEFARERLSRPA